MAYISKKCKICGHQYLAGIRIDKDKWQPFPNENGICATCKGKNKEIKEVK